MKHITAKVTKATLTMALLAAMPLSVVAQTDQRNSVKPTIDYTQSRPYILGGFSVTNVSGYEIEVLRNMAGITEGQSITLPEDATTILNRYYRSGLFANVSVEADSLVGDTIYLAIHLTARPRVSAIHWSGVKNSEKNDLEAKVGLLVDNQITPDMVARAKRIIKNYYEEKGFKNAEVNITQRVDASADNRVYLDIDINKSDRIKVRHIYISGVDDPKQVRKLKGAMKKTKEKSLLNMLKSRKFIPEKYQEDKGYLVDKLNEWGYRDALITSDSVVPVEGTRFVDVYLTVDHGKKYYLRNIDWLGNAVFDTESLARTLNMKPGDVYDLSKLKKRLNEDEDAVGSQYYNSGYVFSSVEPVELRVDGDSIDLQVRIHEGSPATFKNIRIQGNDRAYEEVVRRELRTKPGDLFSRESLIRSLREITSMKLFDPEQSAQPDVKPNPNDGTVDVTYKLVTKSSDQVELSFGWGQTGVVGKVGLTFTNFAMQQLFNKNAKRRGGFLPQGLGQTFSISGQTNGSYYQQYSVSFLDSWFGGKRPNQLQVSAFYSKSTDVNSSYYSNYQSNLYSSLYGYGSSSTYNYTNYLDPNKFIKIYGASVGFGKRLTWPDDYFTLLAQLSYTRYVLKNWNYFLINNGASNNLALTFTLSRNSTDQGFFPRRGSEFMFSVAATPPYSMWNGKDYRTLAKDLNSPTYLSELQSKYRWIEYHKWKYKFRSFTALTAAKHTPVLMTRFEGGLLGHYNKHNKSPYETFYMGGDGMSGYSSGYATETIGLRGYDNGSLTSTGGLEGYAYARMSLELRYPLLLEGSTQIFALAFLEGGNAWTSTSKFNPFNMKRSAGLGVRIMLPMVGLMGIDWAYGFDKINGSKTPGGSHFHFIIGQEF